MEQATSDMGGAPEESGDFDVGTPQGTSDWRESLPEGVQEWQEAQQSKDQDSFWNQMSNMRSMVGNSVRIPSEDASQEVWDDFRSKVGKIPGVIFDDQNDPYSAFNMLGRPQDASEYEWSQVEGFEEDAETEGEFRALAHGLGLTRDQANGVHEWLAENIVQMNAASEQSVEDGLASLKGEWGQAFDEKVSQARAAVNMLDSKVPGFIQYLNESGNGNDPMFIRMASALAGMFGEQGAMEYTESTRMTPQEARMQISDIRNNPEHPYNNEFDPAHEAAKEKIMELYKYASG